jgi:hypothetical protein
MTAARSIPAALTALAAALALSACAGADQGALTYEDSPLNAYLSGAYAERDQAYWDDFQRQVEELSAECMAEQGWEYVPVDYSQTGGGVSFDGEEWKPDEREWVEQYGYGAVRYPGYEEMNTPIVDGPEFVDPNADYLATLSESEVTAYYEALYGPTPSEEDMESGSFEWRWEDSGCNGWATHELQGEDPMQSDEFAPLMTAMQEFWESQSSAPAIAELDRAWSTCMAEQGEPGFTQRFEAQDSIYTELNAVYETQTEGIDLDDPALVAIWEREVALALIDLDCRERTDYTQEQLRLQFEAEEQFITDHQAELDALKAAIETAKS